MERSLEGILAIRARSVNVPTIPADQSLDFPIKRLNQKPRRGDRTWPGTLAPERRSRPERIPPSGFPDSGRCPESGKPPEGFLAERAPRADAPGHVRPPPFRGLKMDSWTDSESFFYPLQPKKLTVEISPKTRAMH